MQPDSSYKNTITLPNSAEQMLVVASRASEVVSRSSSNAGGATGTSCREGGLGGEASGKSGEETGQYERSLQRGIKGPQVFFFFFLWPKIDEITLIKEIVVDVTAQELVFKRFFETFFLNQLWKVPHPLCRQSVSKSSQLPLCDQPACFPTDQSENLLAVVNHGYY